MTPKKLYAAIMVPLAAWYAIADLHAGRTGRAEGTGMDGQVFGMLSHSEALLWPTLGVLYLSPILTIGLLLAFARRGIFRVPTSAPFEWVVVTTASWAAWLWFGDSDLPRGLISTFMASSSVGLAICIAVATQAQQSLVWDSVSRVPSRLVLYVGLGLQLLSPWPWVALFVAVIPTVLWTRWARQWSSSQRTTG